MTASQQPSDDGMAKQRSDVHYCAQILPGWQKTTRFVLGGRIAGPGRGVRPGPLQLHIPQDAPSGGDWRGRDFGPRTQDAGRQVAADADPRAVDGDDALCTRP